MRGFLIRRAGCSCLSVAMLALFWSCAESGGDAVQPADTVDSSGKSPAGIADLPPAVVEVAHRARPGLDIREAEYETRDGREYYDVAGVLPDGREIELDMSRVDGLWTVVEIQRDIAYSELPPAVAETLDSALPDWRAERIIESDQGDGTVIYEFFGPGATGDAVKYEVKWADNAAELLTEEWAH
jgi:hypothetical protein